MKVNLFMMEDEKQHFKNTRTCPFRNRIQSSKMADKERQIKGTKSSQFLWLSSPGSDSSNKVTVMWASLVLLVCLTRIVECQFATECEEIKIPMCKNMPYNLTRLPNLLHHSTQENALLAVEQFELLRWTKCSDQLEFFLCSMYAPICTKEFLSEAIPPCRSVCEATRKGCEPLLARFNISWPPYLRCSNLPLYDRGVCITPEAIVSLDAAPKQKSVETPCECGKERKLRRKVYNTKHFHYVIRGTIRSVETYGSLTQTTLTVSEVVKMTRVAIPTGKDIFLWTNRSCECPPLALNTDYLILGWEDSGNSRLLYLEGSLAVPYRRRYVRKIKSWEGPALLATPQLNSSNPSVPNDTANSLPTFYPESMQVANSMKKRKTKRGRDKSQKKKKRRGRKSRRRQRRRKKESPSASSEVRSGVTSS